MLTVAAVVVSKINQDNLVDLAVDLEPMAMVITNQLLLVFLVKEIEVEEVLLLRTALAVAEAVLVRQVKMDILDQTQHQLEVAMVLVLLFLELFKPMVEVEVVQTTQAVHIVPMEELVVADQVLCHQPLLVMQEQMVLVEAVAVLLTKILEIIQNQKVVMVAVAS